MNILCSCHVAYCDGVMMVIFCGVGTSEGQKTSGPRATSTTLTTVTTITIRAAWRRLKAGLIDDQYLPAGPSRPKRLPSRMHLLLVGGGRDV